MQFKANECEEMIVPEMTRTELGQLDFGNVIISNFLQVSENQVIKFRDLNLKANPNRFFHPGRT